MELDQTNQDNLLQQQYAEIMQGIEIDCNDRDSLAQPYEVKFVESYTTNYTVDPSLK